MAASFSKKLSGRSDRVNKGHVLFQAPQPRNRSACKDHFALIVLFPLFREIYTSPQLLA